MGAAKVSYITVDTLHVDQSKDDRFFANAYKLADLDNRNMLVTELDRYRARVDRAKKATDPLVERLSRGDYSDFHLLKCVQEVAAPQFFVVDGAVYAANMDKLRKSNYGHVYPRLSRVKIESTGRSDYRIRIFVYDYMGYSDERTDANFYVVFFERDGFAVYESHFAYPPVWASELGKKYLRNAPCQTSMISLYRPYATGKLAYVHFAGESLTRPTVAESAENKSPTYRQVHFELHLSGDAQLSIGQQKSLLQSNKGDYIIGFRICDKDNNLNKLSKSNRGYRNL